jgi:hypothetical protein
MKSSLYFSNIPSYMRSSVQAMFKVFILITASMQLVITALCLVRWCFSDTHIPTGDSLQGSYLLSRQTTSFPFPFVIHTLESQQCLATLMPSLELHGLRRPHRIYQQDAFASRSLAHIFPISCIICAPLLKFLSPITAPIYRSSLHTITPLPECHPMSDDHPVKAFYSLSHETSSSTRPVVVFTSSRIMPPLLLRTSPTP